MISLTASSSRPDRIFVMDRRKGASIGHCNCLPTVSSSSNSPNRTLTKPCAACLKKRTQAAVEKAMVHSGSRRGVRLGSSDATRRRPRLIGVSPLLMRAKNSNDSTPHVLRERALAGKGQYGSGGGGKKKDKRVEPGYAQK